MNYFDSVELLDTFVSDTINNDYISFEQYEALMLIIDQLKGDKNGK